jgi:putative membrane protein
MLSPALALAANQTVHWVGFGWWWLFIPLFWILFFVLLFGFLGRRWRRNWGAGGYGGYGGPPWAGSAKSAEATLAERFANGDIDEVEYRARLEVLRANREAPPTR